MSSGASPRSLLEALGDKAALVPRAPSSCRVRRAPLRYEGRVEPGPMLHSALGTYFYMGRNPARTSGFSY
jgi:hypothetical protein